MPYEIIKVKPVTARIGAEIEGVDLTKPLDQQTFHMMIVSLYLFDVTSYTTFHYIFII